MGLKLKKKEKKERRRSQFTVWNGILPENVQYMENQSLTPYSSLRSVNWLHKIFASCVKAASEEPVYKAAALVYVGHHVTSRNTVWPEYIDFSNKAKMVPFLCLNKLA